MREQAVTSLDESLRRLVAETNARRAGLELQGAAAFRVVTQALVEPGVTGVDADARVAGIRARGCGRRRRAPMAGGRRDELPFTGSARSSRFARIPIHTRRIHIRRHRCKPCYRILAARLHMRAEGRCTGNPRRGRRWRASSRPDSVRRRREECRRVKGRPDTGPGRRPGRSRKSGCRMGRDRHRCPGRRPTIRRRGQGRCRHLRRRLPRGQRRQGSRPPQRELERCRSTSRSPPPERRRARTRS